MHHKEIWKKIQIDQESNYLQKHFIQIDFDFNLLKKLNAK